MAAYAQSKLALTMWTKAMADACTSGDCVFVAVNPGSLLGSKMVKEGFGIAGKSLSIGAEDGKCVATRPPDPAHGLRNAR
jgi:NAD(P)-dependent dehydrogenase (short-subunit alcohol dehydrogenase family)